MRILPLLVALGAVSTPVLAQAGCTAGAGPTTTLATMNPFAGTSLYGHPNFPNSPGPGYPGFSFLIDMQPIVDIAISRIDLDLYDDGNLVQVNSTTTVTSPNQVGATTTVTFYLFPGPSWVGNELNQAAWGPLGTGTLTVAPHHTDSQILFNPPVLLPAGSWGIAIQVPPTTTGPNPGPLHPMLINPTTPTLPLPYTDGVLTMTNVQFQRESWTQAPVSAAHQQSIEIHYAPQTGYANWTSFGIGCGSPVAPQLQLGARPRIGTTIDFRTVGIAPNMPIAFYALGFTPDPFGFPLGQFGLPGCHLYLQFGSPLVTSIALVNGGLATLPLPVPNDVSFSGLVLYAQAAPSTGPSAVFALTNAVCVAIGQL